MGPVTLRPQLERVPIYKPLAEIRAMGAAASAGKSLKGVYGFTDPKFSFIHNHRMDWKQVSTSPSLWAFQGVSLGLNVRVDVYLPSDFQQWPDVMAPIIQHEDRHVEDARNIVTTSLPARLKLDPTFKSYFMDRTPIPDVTRHFMFPQKMADSVESDFDDLWNQAVARLDTAAIYAPVQQQVDEALRNHHHGNTP